MAKPKFPEEIWAQFVDGDGLIVWHCLEDVDNATDDARVAKYTLVATGEAEYSVNFIQKKK